MPQGAAVPFGLLSVRMIVPKPKPSFRTYRAERRVEVKLVVGAPKLVVQKGATVEFDGRNVRGLDGRIVSVPSLAAAVAMKWLTPVDDG